MPAETRRLIELWQAARAEQAECALATVVRIAGSSYRKPGARMLITRNGQRAGTVSGGCLEGEVSRRIWWLTEEGPAVREYSTSFDDDSHEFYGLGCDGVVTLLLERSRHAESIFHALESSVERRVASAIITVIGGDAAAQATIGSRMIIPESAAPIATDGCSKPLQQLLVTAGRETLRNQSSSTAVFPFQGRELELFLEYVAPPPALFVFGAGDDAKPLVHLAQSMGWEVTIADGRSHLATQTRFPKVKQITVLDAGDNLRGLSIRAGDAAVLLTHSYIQDQSTLRALLPMDLGYLGVLGPRRRTERIVEEVAAALGMEPETALGRLKSPVGLDLGAGSAEIIALSIVAEIQAVLSHRSAAPLTSSAQLLAPALHG